MPVWRCPHCGIPQPETARCWVCHRSTTSCGTCRHFRRGIAGGLGLCGLDIRHRAVGPAEVRPCWTATAAADPDTDDGQPPVTDQPGAGTPGWSRRDGRPARTFVLVDDLPHGGTSPLTKAEASPVEAPSAERRDATEPRVAAEPRGAAPPERRDPLAATPMVATEPRWSLWGDLDG